MPAHLQHRDPISYEQSVTGDDVTDEAFPVVGVGVVVLDDEDRVLLIQRGQEPNKGLWTIPGGRQEPGESLEKTARREISEETGATIGPLHLVDVVDLIRRDEQDNLVRHYTLIDYAARFVSGPLRPGGDAAAVEWIPVDEIQNHVTWSETIRVVNEAVSILNERET